MRFLPLKLLTLVAESISEQLSGEATAWLVGEDVLVITVAGSPVFRAQHSELEAQAIGIAEQAIATSALFDCARSG